MVIVSLFGKANARLVVVVELCERFSFYGCKGVWGNYIKNAADDPGTPGMLGMGPQGALGLLKFFGFWAYTTPIIGGVIADQYWGRYKTIIVGCICYIVGEVILLLTSIPLKSISTQAHIGGFIASIIVIGIGTGGSCHRLLD
jgi:POT family proton-dependent oligopeptide transporter